MPKSKTLPLQADGDRLMTIAETVSYMGCTDGWVRALLRQGKLKGHRVGLRLWLVSLASAKEARESLTTRATGKRHLAKRPAASRLKKAKRP